jgi:hypothetical protein
MAFIVAGVGDPGLDSWATASSANKSAAEQIAVIKSCGFVFIIEKTNEYQFISDLRRLTSELWFGFP